MSDEQSTNSSPIISNPHLGNTSKFSVFVQQVVLVIREWYAPPAATATRLRRRRRQPSLRPATQRATSDRLAAAALRWGRPAILA